MPLPTAGDDSRIDCVPTRPCHVGAHTDEPHPPAGNTSSLPSFEVGEVWEPTKTKPPATVGESMIWARLVELHRGLVHRECPHPVAGNAHSRPSLDPMYTTPPTTAGEEKSTSIPS